MGSGRGLYKCLCMLGVGWRSASGIIFQNAIHPSWFSRCVLVSLPVAVIKYSGKSSLKKKKFFPWQESQGRNHLKQLVTLYPQPKYGATHSGQVLPPQLQESRHCPTDNPDPRFCWADNTSYHRVIYLPLTCSFCLVSGWLGSPRNMPCLSTPMQVLISWVISPACFCFKFSEIR